ncbi:MAG: hypothetical protein PHF86_13845 [Candidatus Nanoarchaeia archaeon]|nr:hypothetical protein [Candidatus Nanoarchaeia archaeon]
MKLDSLYDQLERRKLLSTIQDTPYYLFQKDKRLIKRITYEALTNIAKYIQDEVIITPNPKRRVKAIQFYEDSKTKTVSLDQLLPFSNIRTREFYKFNNFKLENSLN